MHDCASKKETSGVVPHNLDMNAVAVFYSALMKTPADGPLNALGSTLLKLTNDILRRNTTSSPAALEHLSSRTASFHG